MSLAKPTVRGRILAILVIVALALACALPAATGSPGASAHAASDASGITVKVTYQADDKGFVLARQEVSVKAGLAASYGYTYGANVKASDVTALDALVAAHILMYGKSGVTSRLAVGSGGFITTAFGSSASVITFVNGQQTHCAAGDATFDDTYNGITSYTGDAVNQSIVKAGDTVEFFTIRDTVMWQDNYVWFEKGGVKTESLTVKSGADVALTVRGIMNWYTLAVKADYDKKTLPIEKASVTGMTLSDGKGYRAATFASTPKAVTGADGKVSFKAPAGSGTYYYSATDGSGSAPLFSPWLELKVTAKASFNVAGGKRSGDKSKQVVAGDAYGKLPKATRTGYAFKGWYTKKSGGTLVTASAIVKATKDHTLYARWAAKKYTVKFNANKGKTLKKSLRTKTVTYAKKFGKLPAAKRGGYKFKGWYTKKSGGKKVTAGSVVKITRTTTLYAHWSRR